jgi:glycosyltransferase involved in cell wall biosynthesis
MTGTQRYTQELLERWSNDVARIAPAKLSRGFSGHAWEQLLLPSKVGDRLLFSPSNSGPLGVKKQVLTIHDVSVFDCPETFASRFAAWYQFLLPRLARSVRQIITVSEFSKERILRYTSVAPDKVVVIPAGVSSRFRPGAIADFEAASSSLNLPSRQYVLVVGSLEPRKNLPRLLRAWARVQSCLPKELWLVVVGDTGSARVFSRTKLANLPPRVFLAGRVNESLLPSLYAGALAVAFVSLYEGFGSPLVEAMASGVPVLAGNRSSSPEVVGDAGMTVDPENEEEIAEGIRALVESSSLRQEMHQRGLLRARRFSYDNAAQKTWQVLEMAASS